MNNTILVERQAELEGLLATFLETYMKSEDGQRNITLYESSRETGASNYNKLTEPNDTNEDITGSVLPIILPYANDSDGCSWQVWIHPAPAIEEEVETLLERTGLSDSEDWPCVDKAILSFIKSCIENTDRIFDAFTEFTQSPYSSVFSSSMLSPILNAIRPDVFHLINDDSRRVINYFCCTDYRDSLEDYPAANDSLKELLQSVASVIEKHANDENYRIADYFDIFCHWLFATKQYELPEPNYWKISPGPRARYWDSWRDGNYISVRWSELGDLSGLSESEYESRRDELVGNLQGWTEASANQAWEFSRIRVGDRVVANKGISEVVGIGTVVGPYFYVENDIDKHRIPVRWDDTTPRATYQGNWRSTLMPLPQDRFDTIRKLPAAIERDDNKSDSNNCVFTLTNLASELSLEESVLQRWVTAIERKGQAILYGPPGTGKTFAAEHLAKYLVGEEDGFCELVQFHPAYAYEDFIQGIRPQSGDNGQLSYPNIPGRFVNFCQKASKFHGRCVLIIDEINRADLPTVFGELLYLLEYRDRSAPLATGKQLTIPQNVRLIGTMNTADRSISPIDYALRRRFAFLALYPDYRILSAFHEETGLDVSSLVNVLKKLNETIQNRYYEVGITFFLREDLDEQIEDIWQMEIEPYLEDYYLDQIDNVDRFRWDNIKESIKF